MIKLTFLGDVMCKREMLDMFSVKGKFDFSDLFKPIRPLLADADYVFANLETPITMDNYGLTQGSYSFCSPAEFAQAVRDAGVDFVSTANNHCLDRGVKGLRDTISALDNIGLEHTGTFTSSTDTRPSLINLKGVKIGVASYTYGTNAFANHNWLRGRDKWLVNMSQNQELSFRPGRWCYYNRGAILARIYNKISRIFCPSQLGGPVYERRERSLLRLRKIKRDIKFLKENNVDLSVLLLHIGGQYNYAPTARSNALVNRLLGGVNVICGNHEHVVHNGILDRLRLNRIATFSLGNLAGLAGVTQTPFDKLSEYSIAWHLYISPTTRSIEKSTFSILKTVSMTDGKVSVQLCHDLLNNESNSGTDCNASRQELLCDMSTIAFKFAGRKYTIGELCADRELSI